MIDRDEIRQVERNGKLEAPVSGEAHHVTPRNYSYSTANGTWYEEKMYFRIYLTDKSAVQVELSAPGSTGKLVGTIFNGDKIEVREGEWRRGMLHANWVFNETTNSAIWFV